MPCVHERDRLVGPWHASFVASMADSGGVVIGWFSQTVTSEEEV